MKDLEGGSHDESHDLTEEEEQAALNELTAEQLVPKPVGKKKVGIKTRNDPLGK